MIQRNPQPLKLLDGVKVIAFTQWLFGPAAAQYLSDMGAEVVKVEPQGRGAWERSWAGGDTYIDGTSACFALTHRNIKSVALDLKSEPGLQAARQLVKSADVVISNYRPRVMPRLGLSYEDCLALNPTIIYALASGYGEGGPYEDLPGQDLLCQAISGMIHAGGQEGQVPRAVGAAVVDQHAGLLLASGVLGALVRRGTTGEGQHVAVSLLEAALDLQLEPVVYHVNGGAVQLPATGIGSTFHQAPYGVYACRDGHIVLSVNSLATVGAALGEPTLAAFENPHDRMHSRDTIYQAIAPLLAGRARDETVEELRAAGVWCAPVLSYEETFDNPAVAYLDPLIDLDLPGGRTVRVLRHPVRYSSGTPRVESGPPSVGQHTEEVLREIGYNDEQLAELNS